MGRSPPSGLGARRQLVVTGPFSLLLHIYVGMTKNATPNLVDYDLIVVSTSGGKDSQVMLDVVSGLAAEAGVSDRLRAVHADLGRVEWDGVQDLAAEQAAAFGVPFSVVRKKDTEAAPFDLLDRVRVRRMWPSAQQRWCTSDHKRGAIRPYFTALSKEWKAVSGETRPCRILSTMGMRAEESSARARRQTFVEGVISTSNQQVDEWLPIHAWTETDVWERIRASGVRHHWAYDAGMPRLSCSFCVLGSRASLELAVRLRPKLAAEYAAVEVEVGHRFRQDLSMAEIIEAASA